jgi:Ca-activated chloride channel family protein
MRRAPEAIPPRSPRRPAEARLMRLPLILAAAGVAALALAGPAALGRLALMAGLPGPAAALTADPAVKGVALYRAGRFEAADEAFRAAGRSATFNRGVSLAATGDYLLSRAYFDAVLFAAPGDSEARENRNLVNSLIPPVLGQGNEAGRISVTAIATAGGMPADETTRVHGRRLDAGGLVADIDWLATIPDDPGEFLRLRLADEHGRRLSLGQTPPEEGDLW